MPREILFLTEIYKGATNKLQRIGLAQKLGWGERFLRFDVLMSALSQGRRRHRRSQSGWSSDSLISPPSGHEPDGKELYSPLKSAGQIE
jgi:hypothetical protein